MNIQTLALTLFLIINPLGNLKTFSSIMKNIPHEKHRKVAIRELLIALGCMFFFSLLGEQISWAFSFSPATIRIAAGLILFLKAINILFPKSEHLPKVPGEEPFLVPIAIPLIASPALLATIMLFSQAEPLVLPMIISILLAWGFTALFFVYAKQTHKFLGYNGLLAIERIMGMILVLIAIQQFMTGIFSFILTLEPLFS